MPLELRRPFSIDGLFQEKELKMAVNKPVGDNARRGAVRKRSQLKTEIEGESRWTKRSRATGQFMDQKATASAKKFKGVRREKVK